MPNRIEISHKTIFFTLITVGLIWLVLQILEIVIMIFIACILAAALNPTVERLTHTKLPRPLAIFIVYIFLILGIVVLVASVIPGLVDQTKRLIQILPGAVNRIEILNVYQQELSAQLLSKLGSVPENLLRISVSFFGNLLNVLTTLVMTFYLLLYRPKLHTTLAKLSPDHHEHISHTVEQIEKRLGSWVRGELVLMLSVGSLTYVGLVILGIEIALPLAIIAGVLEIVPNIGPLISAIPAVIIGFSIHPFTGVATICWYFIVQFAENHILVPNIMRKAVGVNPLVSIITLMAGFKLAGPIGAVLSIPLIIVVQTIGIRFFSPNNLSKLAPGDE